MTNNDKHEFEKKLMQDPFDEEAFDGISGIEYNKFKSDLNELQHRLNLSKKRIIPLYLSIAATVAILCIVGISIYNINKVMDSKDTLAEQIKVEKKDKIEKKGKVEEKEERHKIKVSENRAAEEIKEPVIREKVKEIPEIKKQKEILKPQKFYVSEESEKNETDIKDDIIADESLDEVTVVGYGSRKRSDLTGAVASVKNEDLETKNATEENLYKSQSNVEITDTNKQISQNLQGRLAGVDVSGKQKRIMIRGNSSSKENVKRTEFSQASIPSENSIIVKGAVMDSHSGEPLPGVTIIEKGSINGVISDMNGEFELSVSPGSELQVSFVGYLTEEIEVKGTQNLSIQLNEDLMALDEIVVVGYGTQKKSDLTAMEENTYIVARPEMKPKDYRLYILEKIKNKAQYIDEIVKLEFVINEQGMLSDFKVIKSPEENLSKQIIEIMQSGPTWLPAKRGGAIEESTVRYRIKIE